MPQDNISNLEKNIYNTYLRISRSKQNHPFKYRKNFSKFENDDNYVYVKRLQIFFSKFHHISIEDFFQAPYYVYPDPDPYYDLRFYTSPRAIKVFGSYVKMKDNEDPDTDSQIGRAKESLMHIFKFCRDNNIDLDSYTAHSTNDLKTFILHLRDRKVSVYCLFGLPDTETHLRRCSPDLLSFTIGDDFINKLANFKTRYYNSIKLKAIVQQGILNIRNLLHRHKHNI
mgnify:CR=1 FL=1